MPRPPRVSLALILVASALTTGCLQRFYTAEPELTAPPADGAVQVSSPVRAHLADGGVVLFRQGARVGPDTIAGPGWRYGLARMDSVRVDGVAMDSVVGLESAPESRLNVPATVVMTAAATAGGALLTAAALVAMFGSCPTVYASEGGTETLEAELFSYSIAPLLEGRDVDALGVRARDGVVRLDVRNEALETHFINHVQLLELRHEPGERALPDAAGLPVAVAGLVPPKSARDRDGRDVARALAEADDMAFETSPDRLATAAEPGSDLEDVVELVFPRPGGATARSGATAGPSGEAARGPTGSATANPDTVALVLRLRNSLLNTVLFYDMMLAEAGAGALDWMGHDLQRIGPAVALGRWWTGRMGMRVEVWRAGGWSEVTRLPDSGPIAWSEVAVPFVLDGAGDSVRVRLRFVADEWRLDRAALATSVRRPEPITHAATRLLDHDDAPLAGGIDAVAAPDEAYLETRPGDRFVVEFDVGPEPERGTRGWLLSAQGYYSEWLRPDWVRQAVRTGGERLEPGDEMLREAMRRWAARRTEFEREFFATRIPTR